MDDPTVKKFAVEIDRTYTTVVYIAAANAAAAEADALRLVERRDAEPLDGDMIDRYNPIEITDWPVDVEDEFWSGGAKGEWTPFHG